MLEVASATTHERDEGYKRDAYANMGVTEYWRFDNTGDWYQTPLAGDVLVDGQYQPLPCIHRTEEGHYRGLYSPVLNLGTCDWEDGLLRFWDPVGQRYLTTDLEERAARREAEAARDAAEARVRELEEELRRRDNALADRYRAVPYCPSPRCIPRR